MTNLEEKTLEDVLDLFQNQEIFKDFLRKNVKFMIRLISNKNK